MAQSSFFWTTSGAGSGDQQASYSQVDLASMFRGLAEGVVSNHPVLNELACSDGGAEVVDVASGMAIVDGVGFISTAVENVAVPAAVGAGNTRIDRIVIRVDWASFEATITRIAGTDAGSPSAPAITQTSGTTYDLKLCQVLVNVSGDITVTDERVWAQPEVDDSTIEIDQATGALQVPDDGIDSDQIAAGAIDLAHMSANSVDSDQYVDGSIDTAHLANDAVTPAKTSFFPVNANAVIYVGKVVPAEAATNASVVHRLPSGWSYTRSTTGRYRITHSLGSTNYVVTAMTAGGSTANVGLYDAGFQSNYFEVATTNYTGIAADYSFTFILICY